jgi:hypothetical protein
MSDFPPDEASEELWGAPDFEGRTHARPLPDWFSGSKSLLPACRDWREPAGLLDEVVVFASAWFNRPMTGRGIDMKWPDVGFYLDRSWSAAVLVCSPGFRPPFAQRPKGQIVVDPWPDLSAPRDPSQVPSSSAMAARTSVRGPPRGDRLRRGPRPHRDHARWLVRPAGAPAVIRDPSGQARVTARRRSSGGKPEALCATCPMSPWSRLQTDVEANPTERGERGGQHHDESVRVEGHRDDGLPGSQDGFRLGLRTAIRE